MILRFIKVLLAAIILLVFSDILFYNYSTLINPIQFRFVIPNYWILESTPLPLGLFIVLVFCLGMLFAAFMGASSVFYKKREMKAKNRTIRELEREIEELRALYSAEHRGAIAPPLHPSAQEDIPSGEPKIE